MKIIADYFRESKRNCHLGMLSFLLQRITGIGLTFFIFAHLFTLGSILIGDAEFNASMGKFDNTIGHLLEYALLLCVLAHGINGMRIIFTELLGLTRIHERLFWAGFGVFILIALPSVYFFFF
jgi:succinate dehydrogenase cytochrome b556 subunit